MRKLINLFLIFILVISMAVQLEGKKKTYAYVFLELSKVIVEPKKENTTLNFTKDSCSDEIIDIKWQPNPEGFNFVLVNKLDSSISIIWDESAFIDEEGKTHKVTHSGVRYIEEDKSILPSVIPLQAKLEDLVFPTDYTYFGYRPTFKLTWGGNRETWRKAPIYEDKIRYVNYLEFEKIQNMSFEFRVILAIKYLDQKYNYHFFFKSHVTKEGENK